ncbi:flavin reductase family protein [Chloroflexota bacterium]
MQEIKLHDAIRLCSPFPYTLVVTIDKEEKPNAMGLSWWTFTSLEPPMIAVSIGHGRYTHDCIKQNREFVLCFPSEQQAGGAWLCGTRSGREIDKLKEAEFIATPSMHVKPPLIEGSTAAFECKIVAELECSDHTLYNGKVLAIYGDMENTRHIYTVHYSKPIAIDYTGNCDFDLDYKIAL